MIPWWSVTSDPTKTVPAGGPRSVRRWRITVSSGASKGTVRHLEQGKIRIGSAPTNEIVLEDRSVSRHHLEIAIGKSGLDVRDLGSKNGTLYLGSRVTTAELPIAGGVLKVGESELEVRPDDEGQELHPSERERCGRLVGRSTVMRTLFARVERIAPSPATVLIHGETGSGKELVAEALHEMSGRAKGPFVVVDCSAIPKDLIESELFGHERGAFTGASSDRRGAFAEADGGTLFLDEIGELDLSLQPKLLRVLETGKVKPIGDNKTIHVDVRIVAASLRDLAEEVREKRFRADLFYRLSVILLEVPPLRERREDVPFLVEHLLQQIGAPPMGAKPLEVLRQYDWPGNVRQLRNVLERAAALAGSGPLTVRREDFEAPDARLSPAALNELPYKQAKDEMLARFTRDYLEALLSRHAGNVSASAREAKVDRNWIVALARRYGVRIRE
jgi:transcriptional regulator with GAF, ATPase, and Fis domain